MAQHRVLSPARVLSLRELTIGYIVLALVALLVTIVRTRKDGPHARLASR